MSTPGQGRGRGRMNKKEQAAIGEVQNLIGRALGEHLNDRNPNHIPAVERPLREAFELCISVLGNYPPQKGQP
jgi:hypothetical protein